MERPRGSRRAEQQPREKRWRTSKVEHKRPGFPGFRLWLILAIQQAVLDQPGGSAAPGIVRAHAKISLLVGDDGAGLGVADLKPHRVFHSADPRHDPDKGLLRAELQEDCALAAIALANAPSRPAHLRC